MSRGDGAPDVFVNRTSSDAGTDHTWGSDVKGDGGGRGCRMGPGQGLG